MDTDTCTIEIAPAGRTIQTRRGTRLLEALLADNILLRSDCGGKGICGKCNVEVIDKNGTVRLVPACTLQVEEDIYIGLPKTSLLSSHIINKAPVSLPSSFSAGGSSSVGNIGIAIDLGTTTIAVYCCDIDTRKVLSSVAVKNPQALYGDDVMSRIDMAGRSRENLAQLQQLVVGAIKWGVQELLTHHGMEPMILRRMVAVGNPAMIHLLLGENPSSIGVAPYLPAFYAARTTPAADIGFSFPVSLHTLPQVSGFIGGDIIAAALATELDRQPPGTLLVDLGTNGELLLKGDRCFFATSCATGPAFEGATLACGMQATPGAIDRISISGQDPWPRYSLIGKKRGKPLPAAGICGSGVISGVAAMLAAGIIEHNGRFSKAATSPAHIETLDGIQHYIVVPATDSSPAITLSQKDIRSVQLGKAALVSGIEFLLRTANMLNPKKILVAGAFGSHLDRDDMLAIGLLPPLPPEQVAVVGNAAGAGAIMALCDQGCLATAQKLTDMTTVVNLAANIDFQKTFISRLAFPGPPARRLD